MTFFNGVCDAAGCCGGPPHVDARRCFWTKAHCTASLAHVLWPVHRSRVFFLGAVKPTIETALCSGAQATHAPGSIQYDSVFNSQHTPTDFVDFLVNPSTLHGCIQELDTTRIRRS